MRGPSGPLPMGAGGSDKETAMMDEDLLPPHVAPRSNCLLVETRGAALHSSHARLEERTVSILRFLDSLTMKAELKIQMLSGQLVAMRIFWVVVEL